VVICSRDHKVVGVVHKITPPKNQPATKSTLFAISKDEWEDTGTYAVVP